MTPRANYISNPCECTKEIGTTKTVPSRRFTARVDPFQSVHEQRAPRRPIASGCESRRHFLLRILQWLVISEPIASSLKNLHSQPSFENFPLSLCRNLANAPRRPKPQRQFLPVVLRQGSILNNLSNPWTANTPYRPIASGWLKTKFHCEFSNGYSNLSHDTVPRANRKWLRKTGIPSFEISFRLSHYDYRKQWLSEPIASSPNNLHSQLRIFIWTVETLRMLRGDRNHKDQMLSRGFTARATPSLSPSQFCND